MVKGLDQNAIVFYMTMVYDSFSKIETPEFRAKIGSQDQDLLDIAREWQHIGQSFKGLVFSAQQGVSIGQCVEDLELLAQCYTEAEIANQVIFLPLR
jgi:hypothetical protein